MPAGFFFLVLLPGAGRRTSTPSCVPPRWVVAGGGVEARSPLNKGSSCLLLLLRCGAANLHPAGHGGEGMEWSGAICCGAGVGALAFLFSFLPRRSVVPAFWCDAGHVVAMHSVKLPWWRRDGDGGSTATFFNKRLCFFLWASMLLLAGLGGEGEEGRSLRLMQGSYSSGAAGELLEFEDSLKLGAPWWSSSSSSFRCCLFMTSAIWILCRPYLLRLPPPIRGRNGESDGGSLVSDGVGDESWVARCYYYVIPLLPLGVVVAKTGGEDEVSSSAKQLWSWEAVLLSTTSAAGCCRPTSKATRWPIHKPVKDSGISLTSFVRPLSRFAAAFDACTEAGGLVLASGHGGGVADLRLGGGEREGPDCVSSSASEVFSAFARDPCVICLAFGVLCNVLYVHRLD